MEWIVLLPVALLLLISGSLNEVRAQGASVQAARLPVFVYLDGGFGGAYGSCLQLHFRTEFLRHHELSVGYQALLNQASGIPDDYNEGNLLGRNSTPRSRLEGLSLGYGYILPFSESKGGSLIRFAFRGSVLLGKYVVPGNFRRTGYYIGPNYEYDDISRSAIGFVLQPGMLITTGRVCGFDLGLYSAFYKDFNSTGVYANLMLGHVSERRSRGHR